MNRKRFSGWVVTGAAAILVLSGNAEARARRGGTSSNLNSVPYLDVKGSCMDAQKFSSGDDKNLAFKGCMQDETSAKAELEKRWSTFKGKDRSNCYEQARFPSPSYVEVLTCLEMSSDSMRSAPRGIGGQPVPQIGGPVAPGLSPSAAPGGTGSPPPAPPTPPKP